MNNLAHEIRDFRDEDYDEVIRVWELTGLGGAQRGDNLKTIHNTLNSGGKLLVMTMGNKTIGTSWVSNDGRRLYLHHFGILPEYQGKGMSKYLLKASLDYARECKLQIKLEVHRNNEIAVNLYTKAGFAYLGDYDVYIIRNI